MKIPMTASRHLHSHQPAPSTATAYPPSVSSPQVANSHSSSTLKTHPLQYLLSPRTNTHSTGDSSDAYQLPRFETSGTCRLLIGLDHTAAHGEVGSWAGVGLDAGQLNYCCVQYGGLKEFYGGKTTTGANGLITIVLLYSGTAGVGDNEAEVASS